MSIYKKIILTFIFVFTFYFKMIQQNNPDFILSLNQRLGFFITEIANNERVEQINQYSSLDIGENLDFRHLSKSITERKLYSCSLMRLDEIGREYYIKERSSGVKKYLSMESYSVLCQCVRFNFTNNINQFNNIAKDTAYEKKKVGLHWICPA